jgi:formate/nitrite transporter
MQIDALMPAEMAVKAEEIGVRKLTAARLNTFALAVLAGAFIGIGAMFSTVAGAGSAGVLPFGLARLLAGLAFSLGLVLISVGGAELFTGNNLIVMAWMSRRVSGSDLLRHWILVYAGNFVGAVATAALVFLGGVHTLGKGAVGVGLLATATAKLQLGWGQALVLGILCNGLVCLAVWLSYSARTTADRILAIVPPVTAFVAAGFEHSVANMYFIPAAWLVRRFGGVGGAEIGWQTFMFGNLLPVTLGNLIGGSLLVGAVYWFVYLRGRKVQP